MKLPPKEGTPNFKLRKKLPPLIEKVAPAVGEWRERGRERGREWEKEALKCAHSTHCYSTHEQVASPALARTLVLGKVDIETVQGWGKF